MLLRRSSWHQVWARGRTGMLVCVCVCLCLCLCVFRLRWIWRVPHLYGMPSCNAASMVCSVARCLSAGWCHGMACYRTERNTQRRALVTLVTLGPPKRGLVNLRFIIFLNFPYVKIRLLVWDSGLQLIYEIRRQTREHLSSRFTTPPPFRFYRSLHLLPRTGHVPRAGAAEDGTGLMGIVIVIVIVIVVYVFVY